MVQCVCRRRRASCALTFKSVTASMLMHLRIRCSLESDSIDQSAEPDTKSSTSVKRSIIDRQLMCQQDWRVQSWLWWSFIYLLQTSLDILGYRLVVALNRDHMTHCGVTVAIRRRHGLQIFQQPIHSHWDQTEEASSAVSATWYLEKSKQRGAF